MSRSTMAEERPKVVLRPAPTLDSIGEEEWGKFKIAVTTSTGTCKRDTGAEIYLHLAGDDRQPLDVRRRAIWELGKNGENNYLHLGAHDSGEMHIVDSSIGQFDAIFASNETLLRYGAELALEFYESGQDREWNIGYDHSAAILLSAAIPNLGNEPTLLTRSFDVLVGSQLRHEYANHTLITDTIGRTLIEKRIPTEQSAELLNKVTRYDDGTARCSILNVKVVGAVRNATDHFDPESSEPTNLRTYFDNLSAAISDGSLNYSQFGSIPAGMERIGKLESILGANHAYAQLVVERGLFNTYFVYPGASDDEVKQALQSVRTIEDPKLRQSAHQTVHAIQAKHNEQAAQSEIRKVTAKQIVNNFFQR